MEAKIEYKIYEIDTNHLKERESIHYYSEDRVCLIETRFKGMDHNSFDSLELAVKYLSDNTMTYRDYTVLPVIRIID